MVQGRLTSKVISVNFTSCGKNLHSLLNSPQLGPELHNAIPTPTWVLQSDIHSFPGIQPIKVQLSFSCECLHQKCAPITLLLLFHKMAPVLFHNKMADLEEAI